MKLASSRGSRSKYVLPSEVSESVNGSVLPFASGSTFEMLGKSTCADLSIIGITTIKMISSTRTTSTSGVTFITGCGRNEPREGERICASAHPSRQRAARRLGRLRRMRRLHSWLRVRLALLMLRLLVSARFGRFTAAHFQAIDQLATRIEQTSFVGGDARRQEVEQQDRGDRHDETIARDDQRF